MYVKIRHLPAIDPGRMKQCVKGRKHMVKSFGATVIMLVVAGLAMQAFLLSGCKKTQLQEQASSPSAITSAQTSGNSAKGPNQPAIQTALSPEVRLLLRQGIEHMKARDYDKAIEEFSGVIGKYPNDSNAYNDRAAVYVRQDKFDKARDDLNKALQINPRDPVTYYNFASLYALQKQSDPALASLDKALEMGFNDYDFLRSDPDLNNIRKRPEFRRVLERHKVFVPK